MGQPGACGWSRARESLHREVTSWLCPRTLPCLRLHSGASSGDSPPPHPKASQWEARTQAPEEEQAVVSCPSGPSSELPYCICLYSKADFHVPFPPWTMWPAGAGPTTLAAVTKQQTLMEIMKEGSGRTGKGLSDIAHAAPSAKPEQLLMPPSPHTPQIFWQEGRRSGAPCSACLQ